MDRDGWLGGWSSIELFLNCWILLPVLGVCLLIIDFVC